MRIGKYRIGHFDWEGDSFTYGMRVELGDIFGNTEKSEYWRLCDAFKLVYGFDRRVLPMRKRLKVFDGIVKGLSQWIDKETQLLDYTPSDEELRAGIRDLGKKVGSMTTVKQLAKAYGTDPDKVLDWPYSKVFAILYTDLEERKYETKLSKEYERKRTKH